tara:strand:+ start:236 stop:1276 length:1041 start_codon:yes stop_codon:yes gene_type:complete
MKQPEDIRIAQIIDANLDRAREGLRVLEDWARFGLGREDFVKRFKDFRQILGKNHLTNYKQARNSQPDVCEGLSHPEQFKRLTIDSIISSNSARVQEALRVIEEFTRNRHDELASSASKIRYETYQLEKELLLANIRRLRKQKLIDNNLYFITTNSNNVTEQVRIMLNCGIKIIQYRFKGGSDLENINAAIKLKKLCKEYDALFIVNDRLDIALASDADGLHLGQEDLNIEHARRLLGPSKIIGLSANSETEISKAIKEGSDYLGIGPVYQSTTKKSKSPLGIERIKSLTKKITVPWFAIGGINSQNISLLKENNIKKVAIISDLNCKANSKEKAMIIIKTLANEN